MPTITPQGRPTIGGSNEPVQLHRPTVNASTGMNLTPGAGSRAAPQAHNSGQPVISEAAGDKTVTLSPQLSALAREKQKLQREIQAQRDKEKSFESTKGNFVDKNSFAAKFKESPLDALKELGTDYEQFNAAIIAQLNGADPVKELRSEIDNLKKAQEESVNKQYDATLKQYRAEADSLVSKDPKAFHLINKGKHQDAIVQHIVETWQENPDQVLTVEQAAKEVEEVLRENAKAAAEALKEIEAPEAPPAQATRQLPPPQRQAPKTLTQSVEASPRERAFGQFQHLSMKERIAQAVARAQR